MTDTQTPEYYQWVKASERLPVIGELVSARRNGNQYGCLERENDNSTSVYIGASYGIYSNQDDKLENIEWLAQASLPSAAESVEESEYEKLFKPYCLDYTSKESEDIRKENVQFAFDNRDKAFELFQSYYHTDYGSINIDENLVSIHTGGWSENEEMIYEFKKTLWWKFCFRVQITGGHYYFDTDKQNGNKEWDIVKVNNASQYTPSPTAGESKEDVLQLAIDNIPIYPIDNALLKNMDWNKYIGILRGCFVSGYNAAQPQPTPSASFSASKSKEEIDKQAWESWEKVNKELHNSGGVNPTPYVLGFKDAVSQLASASFSLEVVEKALCNFLTVQVAKDKCDLYETPEVFATQFINSLIKK